MVTPTTPTPQVIRQDPWYVRWLLIAVAVGFLGVMVVAPLINLLAKALHFGLDVFFRSWTHPHALAALRLTLFVAVLAVLFNMLFGLAAAWAIARFHFRGKTLLTTLIDLPFSVSPVIAGLIFVLLFGAGGYLGPLMKDLNISIIFAVPGIVIATTFVTFPFIARELIPLMEAIGPEEEEAARTLGASGWQMFWHVTLPNIKWGLLYGILLCNARAIGEFGAVSVVSGKTAGETLTLPIYIENLYQGLGAVPRTGAFAVSTLLIFIAVVILLLKNFLEWKTRRTDLPLTTTHV